DTFSTQLCRISLPRGDHHLRCLALFPLSPQPASLDEILAERGIIVSHETVRQWSQKFGQAFANQIRRRLPQAGDKWHLDEVQVKIAGKPHWLWRAVGQHRAALEVAAHT